MSKSVSVYCLILPTGKRYIGTTVMSMPRRISRHRLNGRSLISKALEDYSDEELIIEILETCKTQDEAFKREKFWIKKWKTIHPKGYNSRIAGTGAHVGRTVSKIVKQTTKKTITELWKTKQFRKLRIKAVKKQWEDPKFRALRSKKQSVAMKARWQDPEYRKRVLESRRNR